MNSFEQEIAEALAATGSFENSENNAPVRKLLSVLSR